MLCLWYAGEALVPADEGIWDNYRVKKQLLHSWWEEGPRVTPAGIDAIGLFFSPVMLFPPPLYSTTIAANLLLVDEIMKAGMSSLKGWRGVHLGTYLADNVFMPDMPVTEFRYCLWSV